MVRNFQQRGGRGRGRGLVRRFDGDDDGPARKVRLHELRPTDSEVTIGAEIGVERYGIVKVNGIVRS